MSRIGKQPIQIPAGVSIELNDAVITVKGSKGELKQNIPGNLKIDIQEKEVIVTRLDEAKETSAFHGLVRSLIANMVEGVSKGFEKKLEIVGVGYRAQANKNKITLNIGFSHPVEYVAPQEIEISMGEDKNKNIITVSGSDKQVVGEVAAKIRSFKKPEPYKGKGIKYVGEHIIRKSGKAAGAK